MLKEFLENHFIELYDEDNYKRLENASVKIKDLLLKSQEKIIKYSLTAFDPNIEPDDVILEEVDKIISEEWKTFVNKQKDLRKTEIRAVVLEALELSIKENEKIATIIYLAINQVINFYNLGQQEKILKEFFYKIREIYVKNSGNFLILKNLIFKLDENLSENFEIDEKKLNNATYLGLYNNGTPPHNNMQLWATNASNSIANAISLGISENNEEILKYLNNIIVKELTKQLHNFISSTNSLYYHREQLLWWKESLYSLTLDKSYRDIDKYLLPIIMSYDVSQMINVITPVQVDYFLKETLNILIQKEESNTIKIGDFINNIQKKENISCLKSFLEDKDIDNGRILLIDFIEGLIYKSITKEQFSEKVGVSLDKEIKITDLLIWIFHNLQLIKNIGE